MGDEEIQSNRDISAWGQHSRGIGEQLMIKMGYEPGKGLGVSFWSMSMLLLF